MVPEFSIFFSSILILYAFLVFFIFSAIYSFSLSNSFVLTNAKSNTTITINNTTKYPGITARFFNTLPVFPFLKYFNALYANIIMTNANITYPHNLMVVSVIPAPTISKSFLTVRIFPNIVFWVFITVRIAIPINNAFLVNFFINKLSFSIFPSTPSK